MIGNTPFTSLYISYWKSCKKCEPEKRNNMDVLVNVMLCFGPKDTSTENPRFCLPQKGSVPFKHDRVLYIFHKGMVYFIFKVIPKTFGCLRFK